MKIFILSSAMRYLMPFVIAGMAISAPARAQTGQEASGAAPSAPHETAGKLPDAPRLEFVYEAHVKLGEQVMSGSYGGQQRGTMQLLGGTFEGPAMRGTVLPSTHDWPVYLGNGVRLTDVAYTFVTDDGAHLFLTVNGFRYDTKAMSGALLESERRDKPGNPLRVFVKIQAPDNSRYAWLNYNLFVGVAGTSSTMNGVRVATLRVYRVL